MQSLVRKGREDSAQKLAVHEDVQLRWKGHTNFDTYFSNGKPLCREFKNLDRVRVC